MKLKDFAQAIGLSPTTVSRALSGYPEVSEVTRARVMEEAAKQGYRPNINAVRLATGRVGAIGLVMNRTGDYQFSEFMSGMAERLGGEDIDILVTPQSAGDSRDELQLYRQLAETRRVDAVVLHTPRPGDPRIALLKELKLPFIVHGRSDIDIPYAWLDIDNEGAIRLATRHLIDLGHRRIALIDGREGMTFTIDREKGYRAALTGGGIDFDPALVMHGDFTDEIGFNFARTALELEDRPTGFVAGSMMTALGVYRAARAAGLTVGKDISVVAHDDVFPYLTADNMAPTLSTTRSSIRAAGSRIADLVLQMLSPGATTDIAELWPVELIKRDSSCPPPTEKG